MAQIELRISSKIQKVTGKSEIMIRFFQGTSFDLYAKSEVYVSPEYFEYYINREKTEKAGVKVPGNTITASVDKAKKNGYFLRKSGTIVFKQRLETPDVKYHRQQVERLEKLKKHILDQFESADKGSLASHSTISWNYILAAVSWLLPTLRTFMSYHVLFPDMRDSFEPLTRQERHSHLQLIRLHVTTSRNWPTICATRRLFQTNAPISLQSL